MAMVSEKYSSKMYGKCPKFSTEPIEFDDLFSLLKEQQDNAEREKRMIELISLKVQLKEETQKIIRCRINGIRCKDKRWIIQQKIDALENPQQPI